ncbi:uncharacterized protein TNCV_2608391 [Trichonephila clavipes]|uniref:Uncharacterized protein n=1 Tax=Trichonephila clavipes TaxID=2585209 RepID=A0A8X6S460_TRICX|nr:uncharacterized protein TNCV_2608391 [Trichonephila clavipes]
MVEHLVMGLKTSPNHIGLGSALETGGWQFIDQHGYMRRLNQMNLSGFHRSQAKGKVFFGKKYVVVNVNHPLVGIFEQSIWISQHAFRCFFPHHVVGSKFIGMLCLHDGPFEIVQPRLFYANGLYKTEQTPVWRWALGRWCQLGLGPAEQHIPTHRVYRAASRAPQW